MRKSIENLTGRKYTGGKITPSRSRKKYETDRYPNEALVGMNVSVSRRTRGGNYKTALKSSQFANVTNPETRMTQRATISQVVRNPANRDYERRGVVNKGAIIQTGLGVARVTSRPGQHGCVNAVQISQ
jgi:small subunit ribosomal protein S8e